jgi:hypothetical protein
MEDDPHRLMIVAVCPQECDGIQCLLLGIVIGASSVLLYLVGWRLLAGAFAMAFP